jgi:hypothetical protein
MGLRSPLARSTAAEIEAAERDPATDTVVGARDAVLNDAERIDHLLEPCGARYLASGRPPP